MPKNSKNITSNQIELTVIVPCFNEELNIERVISTSCKFLRSEGLTFEIIIVNDGSRDSTKKIIENILRNYPEIKLINHKKNMGLSSAFWTGAMKASGLFTTVIPGDGENNIKDIAKKINHMEDSEIVITYVTNKETRGLIRRIFSFIYLKIVNISFNTSFKYTNGTNIYNSILLKRLISKKQSFFFQTEILIRAVKSGYRYTEAPIKLNLSKKKLSAISAKQLIFVMFDFLCTFWGCVITKKDLISLEKNLKIKKPNEI